MRETSDVLRRLVYYQKKYDPEAAPGFHLPNSPFELLTSDGVLISGTKLEGPRVEGAPVWLVVHGLLANHRAPGLREFAESIARYGEVWTIDLRGHGLSGGECTLGNGEAFDVSAAVEEIRRQTQSPVVLVGFSMGAAACMRAAALLTEVDGVVAVSGPGEWHGDRRWAAHITRLIWRTPGGPFFLKSLTGVRIRAGWLESESPASVAGKIAPAPVLIVHGTADQFFPMTEAELLFDNASEPKEFWQVEGGGHAEGFFMEPAKPVDRDRVDRFTDELVSRIEGLRKRVDW